MVRKLIIYRVLLFTAVIPTLGSSGGDTLKVKANPIDVQFQYAGNMGLVSAGVGKCFFNEKFNMHLIYGYLPKSINGVSVHTFALKSSYQIVDFKIDPYFKIGSYTGFSLLYGITRNTYMKYPDYYPDEYYDPNALHIGPFIGFNISAPLKSKKINKLYLYAELGTIDYQIYYGLVNKTVKPHEILNLSFGVSFRLA
jgi:hypothetical protein